MFLTYPQINHTTREAVIESLIEICKPTLIKSYVIGKETHQDGSDHYHVLLLFVKAPDWRSSRCLDLQINGLNFHPNIKKVGASAKDYQFAAEYCMKEDPHFLTKNFDWIRNSANFVKLTTDHNAWRAYISRRRLTEVEFPLAFPAHLNWPPITNIGKKRHIWIVGRPDAGKSSLVHTLFDNKLVFFRPAGSKYPFDGYNQEQVLIYDDCYPPFAELSQIANNYTSPQPIAGDQRYHQKYWKPNQQRLVIVLHNDSPQDLYQHSQWAPVDSRFNVFIVGDGVLLYEPEAEEDGQALSD